MADDFALGNALETIGQGVSQGTNQYFQGQINAAQKAQEDTLKQMQIKADQDEKATQLKETNRHNVADETVAQQRAAQEADYQTGELQNSTQRTQAEVANAANEQEFRAKNYGLDAQKTKDDDLRTQHEINKPDSDASSKEPWQIHEKFQSVSSDLKDAQNELKTAQAAKSKLPDMADDGTKADAAKAVSAAQARIDALTKQRDSLLDSGGGVAPTSAPSSTPAPTPSKGLAPSKPSAGAAANPPTATGPDGQKLYYYNGQWNPA